LRRSQRFRAELRVRQHRFDDRLRPVEAFFRRGDFRQLRLELRDAPFRFAQLFLGLDQGVLDLVAVLIGLRFGEVFDFRRNRGVVVGLRRFVDCLVCHQAASAFGSRTPKRSDS
jgi:hypothetical protein